MISNIKGCDRCGKSWPVGNPEDDSEEDICPFCGYNPLDPSSSQLVFFCPVCKSEIDEQDAFCPKCGGIEDEAYNVRVEEQIDAAMEAYEKQGSKGTLIEGGVLREMERRLNRKFEKFIDPVYIKMFSRCIISTVLYKATWPDGLGMVRPNLFCFMIGESGVRKSPILNKIDDITSKVTKNVIKTHKFTPSYLLEEAREWKHRHPQATHIFPVLTERDEMTTLIKEGSNGGGFYGEMPEFLCQTYDGWIKESDSKTDKREGIKHERHRVYHTLIGASTPTFLSIASDDSWWEGGLFNRALWAYVEGVERISSEDAGRVMENDIGMIDEYIVKQLKNMENYEEVGVNGDALLIWHEWIAKINNRHVDIKSLYTTYCMKQIHVVIKLATISAASRHNITEVIDGGIKKIKVIVEKEDVEWAIKDLEDVWFPQAEKVIAKWQELREPVKFQNEKRNIDKIRHYLQSEKDRYIETRRNIEEDGRTMIYLRSDERGDWVYHNNVLRSSNLLSRIFQGYEDTLVGVNEIEVAYAIKINDKDCFRPVKVLRSTSPKILSVKDVEDQEWKNIFDNWK